MLWTTSDGGFFNINALALFSSELWNYDNSHSQSVADIQRTLQSRFLQLVQSRSPLKCYYIMNVALQWLDSGVQCTLVSLYIMCCGLFYELELVYLSFTQNTSGILYMYVTKNVKSSSQCFTSPHITAYISCTHIHALIPDKVPWVTDDWLVDLH